MTTSDICLSLSLKKDKFIIYIIRLLRIAKNYRQE